MFLYFEYKISTTLVCRVYILCQVQSILEIVGEMDHSFSRRRMGRENLSVRQAQHVRLPLLGRLQMKVSFVLSLSSASMPSTYRRPTWLLWVRVLNKYLLEWMLQINVLVPRPVQWYLHFLGSAALSSALNLQRLDRCIQVLIIHLYFLQILPARDSQESAYSSEVERNRVEPKAR